MAIGLENAAALRTAPCREFGLMQPVSHALEKGDARGLVQVEGLLESFGSLSQYFLPDGLLDIEGIVFGGLFRVGDRGLFIVL
jgi:hypothetical protein